MITEKQQKAIAFIENEHRSGVSAIEEARIMDRILKTNNMTQEELKKIGCSSIEDLIAEDFGEIGTPERDAFELSCDAFIIGERLKLERQKAGMTQEELAQKIGTKKSFISRVENGRTDIQLSTLSRIFGGLGKRVAVTLL